ncbi:MAG: lipoate--protein ligase family protein [Chlamydiae bacterium]|nr:lipoate--protein ligase family protein [Chlamydiota bacterium]
MDPYLLITENVSIFEQLKIEEGFLRTQKKNLIWINMGSKESCVLGISSKIEELLDLEKAKNRSCEVIRRYSGGGTVVVDSDTIFVTFIFNLEDLGLPPFPQPLMEWSKQFYARFMGSIGFDLKENDYVIDEKKFGGNAQYLTKGRCVHHSTLLFDMNEELMQILTLPKKRPIYRQERDHHAFLTLLKAHFPTKKNFVENLIDSIEQTFNIELVSLDQIKSQLTTPYRQSTHTIDLSSLSHSAHQSQIDQKMLV